MMNRKKVSIFLIISMVLIVVALIKFNYAEKIINYIRDWNSRNKTINKTEDDINNYPEKLYEAFLDEDGNEVVVGMERKIGTIDGENVIFYENRDEAEIVYCHFYQGTVKSINDEKIIFLVDKECKNADLDESYYDYKDVEDYELELNLNEYNLESSDESESCYSIFINSNKTSNMTEIEKLMGKYIVVQDFEFVDIITKDVIKSLDFYIK